MKQPSSSHSSRRRSTTTRSNSTSSRSSLPPLARQSSKKNEAQPSSRRGSDSTFSLASIAADDLVHDQERLQVLERLEKLSCHVPRIVQQALINQVVKEENEQQLVTMLGKSISITGTHANMMADEEDTATSHTELTPNQRRRQRRHKMADSDKPAPPRRCNSLKSSLSNQLSNTAATPSTSKASSTQSSLIGLTFDDSGQFLSEESDTSSIEDDQSWGDDHDQDDGGSDDDDDDTVSSSVTDDQVEALLAQHTSSTGSVKDNLNNPTRTTVEPKRNQSCNSLPELLLLAENQQGTGSSTSPKPKRDQGVSRLVQGRLSSSMSVASCQPNLMTMHDSFSDLRGADTRNNNVNNRCCDQVHVVARKKLDSVRHNSALLFVDISGFTRLSQSLEVESLSKVINSYFQKIVEIIQAYNGDVLKFAGDALIVEWKDEASHKSKAGVGESKHLKALVLATICAAKLVDACSDFAVRIPNKHNMTTLLDIHCALGFGKVAGTHVGNQQRMEYVVCGDALRQIAHAIKYANKGEVVASPEVIRTLKPVFVFDNLSIKNTDESPQVIAVRSQLHFRPVDSKAYAKTKWDEGASSTRATNNLGEQLTGWTMSMLKRLHDHLAPYVHPAVHESPSQVAAGSKRASISNIASSSRNHHSMSVSQRRRSSRRLSIATSSSNAAASAATEDAKLRDVLTIFLQPALPEEMDLMSSTSVSEDALTLLQNIMMIVQTEVEHFRGQLRQFICDDKGLVIIVNFGLPGSTFPNMVEERAIPCITKCALLLKTELDLECKIGATYGKAYCGVVGDTNTRHEYAVLGPSVNLAARLMGNKDNPGTLVDQALKFKAGPNYPFRSLPPIAAKGYDKPVRIYEPSSSGQKAWVDIKEDQLVGRSAETFKLLCLAKEILNATKSKRKSSLMRPSSKMVFINGQYGVGKSALLSTSIRQIEFLCRKRSAPHHVTRHVFTDEDSFKPFSIVRPLFLDILRQRQRRPTSTAASTAAMEEEVRKQEEAHLHLLFLQTCLQAAVPMQYIEMFSGLIFTDKLSDGIGKWSDKAQRMREWEKISRLLVQVYLEMTQSFELVVLALDDLSGMDEFSWKIVRRLYSRTSKFLIVGASRNEFGLNLQRQVWDELIGDEALSSSRGNFHYMRLGPLGEEAIAALACKHLSAPNVDKVVARTVYLLSEGNPFLASEILEQMYETPASKLTDESTSNAARMESVKDVLLNRLDSLPAPVRLHLNCGAMLGLSFSLSDALAVMEKYNGIATPEEKVEHDEIVRQSLQEAEQSGFLASSQILGGNGPVMTLYSFSHPLLREVISHQILQEWKDKIQRLIDATRSSDYLAAHPHESRREFSAARNKPIRSV